MNDLLGHSIVYRIAVGPQAGQKVFTLTDVLVAQPGKAIADVKVACLGPAFKPDIDDFSESPAVEITKEIAALGCQTLTVEPNIESLPPYLTSAQAVALADALGSADLVCVLIKHSLFQQEKESIRRHGRVIDVSGLLN